MIDPVKPKRRYASARRNEQAADTRATIIAAARRLFVAAGWKATTIAGVAREAGVASETIYAAFSNKQGVLKAVIEATIRRSQPDVKLLEQPGPKAIAAAAGQREQLLLFARDIAEVLGGVAELMAVVRAAAETDPDMAGLYRGLHDGRRRNLGFVASALLARGPLRDGMDEAEATAILWRLASPELFVLLKQVEGLDVDGYAHWLAKVLQAAMLEP